MIWCNIGCGPFKAETPWVNLDCVETDLIRPDLVVDPISPLASFSDNSVDRVYAGHVVEHVSWSNVPSFLAGIYRVMKPGASLVVVGPDVLKAIQQWSDGLQDWETVLATLEGASYIDPTTNQYVTPQWENARHHWNCTEDRLVYVLSEQFKSVEPLSINSRFLNAWPVVSRAAWQTAVRCSK